MTRRRKGKNWSKKLENRASYEFNQRTVVIRRFEGLKERRSSIARLERAALNAEGRLYAAFRRRWYEEDRDLMNFPAKQIKWKPCFEWVSCSCSYCCCFVEIIEIVRYSSLCIFIFNCNWIFKQECSLFIDLFVVIFFDVKYNWNLLIICN